MIEVWYNEKEQITVESSNYDMWYLEIKNGTRYVSGINLYWLLSNGFKKV